MIRMYMQYQIVPQIGQVKVFLIISWQQLKSGFLRDSPMVFVAIHRFA